MLTCKGVQQYARASDADAGILPLVGVLSGHLRLDVHGFGAVLLLQAVWGVVAGRAMLAAPS